MIVFVAVVILVVVFLLRWLGGSVHGSPSGRAALDILKIRDGTPKQLGGSTLFPVVSTVLRGARQRRAPKKLDRFELEFYTLIFQAWKGEEDDEGVGAIGRVEGVHSETV